MRYRYLLAKLTILAAALAAQAIGPGSEPVGAQEKSKELSEKTVKYLMDLAWQVLPAKFTTPTGKKIEVDKTKREPVMIPVEIAREVVVVGYNSGIAQLCEMWEEQHANYHTLMRREIARKKGDGQAQWSEQQLLFINNLHRMSLHLAMGKVRVEEKNGEQHVYLEPLEVGKGSCPDEKRVRTKSAILDFLKKNGVTSTNAVAPVPGIPPAVPVNQPAPAKQGGKK